jgi:hypothetical protein
MSYLIDKLLDIIGALNIGAHVYFADPSALQGSLV